MRIPVDVTVHIKSCLYPNKIQYVFIHKGVEEGIIQEISLNSKGTLNWQVQII